MKKRARSKPLSKSQRRDQWRIVGISLGAAVITFVIGYVIAVELLFPPLPEPKNGIEVPSLTGLQVQSAEARLRRLGLRVTDVVEIVHPTQPPGIIVAQNPLPGQQLRTAGAVMLGVSSGVPRLTVPNVIGFTLERALSVLSSAGFEANQGNEPSNEPAGTVLRISPEPGTQQTAPGRVLLIVSSGPAPVAPDSTSPPADTLAVSASRTTT